MPSPTLLDFDALVAPIAGDNPAGVPLPYDVKLKLEDFRKEINPEDYDADDPRRPTDYRKPEWAAIVKLATETLATKSKDLLAAARLTEALTIEHGFAGLRDGVDLLSRLADHAWDRVYPVIEAGETMEVREGPFKWLNQLKYGALFPATVRNLPLIRVGGKTYSSEDWHQKDRRPAFEAAMTEVKTDDVQNLVDDLTTAKERLDHLNQVLADKLGEYAPDFTGSENSEHLGAAIKDCLKIANVLLQKKTGGQATGEGASSSDGSPGGGGQTVDRTLATRADAYRMLNDAADMLQRLEPHSPIPYLVKRAVRLGDLKFPELMKALIRENATIDELNRVMGLEQPAPPA